MSFPSPQEQSTHRARRGGTAKDFHDPLWLIPRALTKLYSLWVTATYPFASVGRRVSFHYTCNLQNPGRIRLGNDITVQKDTWLHAQAAEEGRTEPALIIEDRCFIGRRSHLSARNCIHLERDVMLSASVYIGDNGHAHSDVRLPIRRQGMTAGGRVRIGQGSWIGQNAAILCDKGELNLGCNCVVAANAVVTRSAPAYSVLSGNPARIVKQYDPEKRAWVLGGNSAGEMTIPSPAAAQRGVCL